MTKAADGLKAETLRLRDELLRTSWLSSVGYPISDDVGRVTTWSEAIVSCESISWENTKIDATNNLTGALFKINKERYNRWNDVLEAVKAAFSPLIQGGVTSALHGLADKDDILSHIRWDVWHIGMECEFAEIYDYRFYRNLAKWYIRGHYPCGWEGSFPEGRLIVY